ncbi:AAA family ATPase [Nocardia sp. CA-129566]|uniref:AAA family ATPase n=1 Tax=Nocardia sp. CA-129566 TaxID=3239976 RepID=UPI003D98F8F3
MTRLPTLVVVSGPPGAGKTTLARALATRVGCPAISRNAPRIRPSLAEVPTIVVDTTNGYRPGLHEIAAFVNGHE